MKLIPLFALLLLFACGSRISKAPQSDGVATAGTPTVQDSLRNHLYGHGYFNFGKYCGHCLSNCSSIYTYNLRSNAASLSVDRSDHFLREDVKPDPQPITDKSLLELAAQVYRSLPAQIVRSTEGETRFGCPDCADQCGYYIELPGKNGIQKFYIDTETGSLEGEMKAFAELLKSTLETLREKQ